MYPVETLEQALSQEKLKKFAADLGMKNPTDLIECSKFINERIGAKSKQTLGRFTKEFYEGQDPDWDLPEIEKYQVQAFDKAFVCSLLLGETQLDDDQVFPVYGAVFKSKKGDLYTIHIDLDADRFVPLYFFNNEFIGDIGWSAPNYDGHTVPEKFYDIMCSGIFETCNVNKIANLLVLSKDERDNYFVPFYR